MRRRRPGEGKGRGPNRGTKSAFLRSRDFVLKIRGMSRWNWRGVLQELEAAEEAEARFGEVSWRRLDNCSKAINGGGGGREGEIKSNRFTAVL